MNWNLFKGFEVKRGGTLISYADDNLCIGEETMDNLSTLKVNFHKSFHMGVNVNPDLMNMTSSFLNCKLGRLSFMYLVLQVEANARKIFTLEPMLDHLRRKLNYWGNKYISLGG